MIRSPKRAEGINSRITLAVFGATDGNRDKSILIEGQD